MSAPSRRRSRDKWNLDLRTHLPIRSVERWLLPAILVGALALRLATIRFGLPALNDPDELNFELGALTLLRGPTLNPGWFGHPATTTFYALALIDAGVFLSGWLAGWFASPAAFAQAVYHDPSWIIVPGRIFMVLFGVLVVALTFRLAERLFDRRTGLAAAAMLAVAPVHVAWSQIIRADMMATAFMLLSMLASLRVLREGRAADTLKAALWLSLAVASKWPFGLGALAMLGAVTVRLIDRQRPAEIGRLICFGIATLAGLFLVSPYLLIAHNKALSDAVGEAQPYHLGATGGSFGENAIWYLEGPLAGSFGVAGLIAAAFGLALMLRRREARAIVLPVGIVCFLLFASQKVVWIRWTLPLLPLLAISAASAAIWIYERVAARRSPPQRWVLAAALTLALGLPPILADVADGRERMRDTRQLASHWVLDHAPPGSQVMVEQFAFDLLGKGLILTFPVGDAGCVDVEKALSGKLSFSALQGLHQGRSNIDYGTMASNRVPSCAPDFAVLSQYDRYLAERARFPRETAQYEALLARGRTLAVFSPAPGEIGGPVVRIVALTPRASESGSAIR